MNNKISIIGGDLRIVNLAQILQNDGFEVYTFALEKVENENLIKCDTLKQTMEISDIIISSVPLSRDNKNIYSPYSKEQVSLETFKFFLKNKIFIAGKIPENLKCEECNFYDLLKIEEYAVLNAIATAEGAIQIAMEEYPKTLLGSNILVMGFGRIGKIVAKMLQGIGANVYCEARKNTDLAYIKAYGYTPINLETLDENLHKFDIVINNIPALVLDKKRLGLLKNDVLIIDLASKPGGVDFEYAKSQNIKTIWALGLPGKVAPISSAEYIKEIIYNIIKK